MTSPKEKCAQRIADYGHYHQLQDPRPLISAVLHCREVKLKTREKSWNAPNGFPPGCGFA